MSKKRVIGVNFLHRHPGLERNILSGDKYHVIVDKEDWEEVCDYILNHHEKFKDLLEKGRNNHPIK